MIEANAFIAAFAVQILIMSVLIPAWTTRNIRARAASSSERLAQLYPGVDLFRAMEAYRAQHRALTSGLAVLGMLLLGWLFSDLWRADWNGDKAGALAFGYFIVAVALPTIHLVRFIARFKREHKPAELKRTAILQRRRLLDFVSPLTLAVAALSYLLFVALVFYIEQHPFPGFGGPLANIGILTLGYVGLSIAVYIQLYGKNRSRFESPADHLQRIGLTVKGAIYVCIAVTVNASITLALQLLELKSWAPVAGSVFFTTLSFLSYLGFSAPPRKPEMDELRSSPIC